MDFGEFLQQENCVDQLNKACLKLCRENPDFIYPDDNTIGCEYNQGPTENPDKCSGCLFGQGLKSLGVNVEMLSNYIDMEIDEHGSNIPLKQIKKWRMAQDEQDSGTPWGKLEEFFK